jgi:hypothetical protein
MSAQPLALVLANKLAGYSPNSGYATYCHKAAAELRRLHESNAELLEALKSIAEMYNCEDSNFELARNFYEARCIAGAAIAKAEGEMK